MPDVQQAVEERVAPHSPELSSVVEQLLADPHALNVTDSLRNPALHERVLATIEELARGDAMRPYGGVDLPAFLADHPGRGPLYEQVAHELNHTADGRTRLGAYVEQMKADDPSALESGATSSPAERLAVEDYAHRLQHVVRPAVDRELAPVVDRLRDEADGPVDYNSRPKDADGLIDKVRRMTRGRPGDAGRGQYRVGDIVDAVGARITVPDMSSLQRALTAVVEHFGVGDGGRIVEIDNTYARPKSKNPAYRVIPLVIGAEIDGLWYAFELQLATLRASVAADIERNSLYKPYIVFTDDEQQAVREALSEAAARDQLEMTDE